MTSSNLLVNSWERMPRQIEFRVPTQFVVEDSNSFIQIEPTLEKWRMASRGKNGEPVVHPGALGTCAYDFAGKTGCDFYPFTDAKGQTRYIALRYMAREAEKKTLELEKGDLENFTYPSFDGQPAETVLEYSRSKFFEAESGDFRLVPKSVDLQKGKIPPADTSGGRGQAWVEDEDDLSRAPSGQINCDTKPNTAFKCAMCICHNEANKVFENKRWRTIKYEGRYAVVASLKTRVGMESYGKNICDVAWFKGQVNTYDASGKVDGKKWVAHYSFTLEDKDKDVKGDSYKRCYQPVKDVLEDMDEHFASHYHTRAVNPGWKCYDANGRPSRGRYIDGHIFYDTCDKRKRATPENMQPIKVEM